MSRSLGVALTTCGVLFLAAGAASAQYSPSYPMNHTTYGNRALLSPYLSLVNGGNPGINYFNRVLPEFDRRATQQLYGAAIGGLESRALTPPTPSSPDADLFTPLPTTGHAVAFQNTGGYFPTPNIRPMTQTAPGVRR